MIPNISCGDRTDHGRHMVTTSVGQFMCPGSDSRAASQNDPQPVDNPVDSHRNRRAETAGTVPDTESDHRPRETGRPKMEIGNCWTHATQPNLVHYMLHYTDTDGWLRDRHLLEPVGTALGKILLERVRP